MVILLFRYRKKVQILFTENHITARAKAIHTAAGIVEGWLKDVENGLHMV